MADNCTISAGEPLGTDSAAALSCNAKTIDLIANSTQETATNRLGATLMTLTGFDVKGDAAINDFNTNGDAAINDFNNTADNLIFSTGFNIKGTFASGVLIETYQDALWYDDGNGAELFAIASNVTLPYTTTAATPDADSADWRNVTLQNKNSVARSLNVRDNEVVYHDDTVTLLDNVLYIYDKSANQKTWRKPLSVGAGETILTVVGDQLTTTGGTYTLIGITSEQKVFCALDYGMEPAPADSTEALRRLCNAVNENGGGKMVFPLGISYLVSKSSELTTSNFVIEMHGGEITFENDLIYDGIGEDGGNGTSYGGVFYINSGNDSTTETDNEPDKPANVLSNIQINGLKIRQTGNALVNVQACRGIRFRSCENVEVMHSTFENLAGEDLNGWFYENDFRIHDNLFIDSRTLSISMMLQDSECYANKFIRCEQPFELTATRVRVRDNTANCVTSGNFIKTSDSSKGYKQDVEIYDNKAYGSFNSFFANAIIVSGDRYNRVISRDNDINCEITSGRVYNLLPASGEWTLDHDTTSDKGLTNPIPFFALVRPPTPESTLDGNYTVSNQVKVVGWASGGTSTLQDKMNQDKYGKVNYFNNKYIIKDGVTDHPSQGNNAGFMASNLYRGSLFVDNSLPINYVISNCGFDNGSETIIDRSPDTTCLMGSETAIIFRTAAKTMTRFYGKPGNVFDIVVPLDAPGAITIQNNSNIVNIGAANLVLTPGSVAKYGLTDTGSKIFQIS